MLVEKMELNEIYCLKLVNGDEIIARIESQENDNYIINRPTTIIPSAQGIGLIQSLLGMKQDSSVKINKQHIMMFCEVDSRIRDHYIQTTTGIKPVTKDKIII